MYLLMNNVLFRIFDPRIMVHFVVYLNSKLPKEQNSHTFNNNENTVTNA